VFGFVFCPIQTGCPSTPIRLLFTLPEDVNGIQFAFQGGALSIVAPIPEASTWAMLLIGFAGIGFLTHRSRRHLKRLKDDDNWWSQHFGF
jgi:hypothetical protein